MAIQNRRGIYSDFDPTKMVEGEFAVVQSGDPNTTTGKAVYISTATGTAERIALYDDLHQDVVATITDATDEIVQDITEGVAEDVTRAETAATNAEASAEEAAEILENKADVDGTYPSLYAGNLASTRKYTDSVPYLFRRTAGGASKIGEREDDTIVGATVRMNQLIEDPAGPGAKTMYSGMFSSSAFNKIEGHRYLYRALLPAGCAVYRQNRNEMTVGYYQYAAPSVDTMIEFIGTCPQSGNSSQVGIISKLETTKTTFHLTKCQVVDLTAKFGSTIADYLYSLEQTTAGSGIVKLRELGFLTDEDIPHNEGSLESVQATAHVMRDAGDNIIGNYNLGTDTLRGLFKLDAENRLYADGDTKTSDGTVTRKYGVVDLGTLEWTYASSSGRSLFTTYSISNLYKPSGSKNVPCNAISSRYTNIAMNTMFKNGDFGLDGDTSSRVVVCDNNYTDAATFKSAISGVMLVYELATPTTEQSTPFTNPQICYPDGTEEYVTSNGVPVGHVTEYDYDIKGLAEELIDVSDVPSSNGTYVLKATRSASGVSYEWVSET